MKALLMLLAISLSVPSFAGVDGNGGGGVNQNGVYKTFYSAGVYVSPEEETAIPGAELYTKTILSIAGQNVSTSKLLAAGLPIANRKFYKILENKMEPEVMNRLLSEYARIVNQPVANLAIFAITDINYGVTYLLPSFYKLSETEQAAILFHEAYWILNPRASYSNVVAAESSFQKFVEAKAKSGLDNGLTRILGEVLGDPLLAVKTAFLHDKKTQNSPTLISKDGNIKLRYLLGNNSDLCDKSETRAQYDGRTVIGTRKYDYYLKAKCELDFQNLNDVLELSRQFPKSFFMKELMKFLADGNKIYIEYQGEKLKNEKELYKVALERALNHTANFERANMGESNNYYYRESIVITDAIINN